MNTYSDSTGVRKPKSLIDRKIREAKEKVLENQKDEYGFNFCVECKVSSGVRLDCSHDKSVNDCQNDGTVELAWSEDNIKIRCRPCHQIRDGLNLGA